MPLSMKRLPRCRLRREVQKQARYAREETSSPFGPCSADGSLLVWGARLHGMASERLGLTPPGSRLALVIGVEACAEGSSAAGNPGHGGRVHSGSVADDSVPSTQAADGHRFRRRSCCEHSCGSPCTGFAMSGADRGDRLRYPLALVCGTKFARVHNALILIKRLSTSDRRAAQERKK
jgi:hypothetical protein